MTMRYRAAAQARLELFLSEEVVARDGIEPPTPAFSGPRSTTELSGLSANFGCISTRGFRARPEKEGNSTSSLLQQLKQYINSHSHKPNRGQPRRALGLFRRQIRLCPLPIGAAPALHWKAIMRRLSTLARLSPACRRRMLPGIAQQRERGARRECLRVFPEPGPPALYSFLEQFPKGADLHVHLSGAVYAETFIRDAGEDGLCVDSAGLKFAKPPCKGSLIPATALSGAMTAANQNLYDRLIDAFSMRSYFPVSEYSGHDQFFATFDRFAGLDKRHFGEWVSEIADRSGEQNQQYLELMDTPSFSHAAQIAHAIGWNQDFAKFRQELLDHGLRDELTVARYDVRQAEARRHELEHCGTSQATSGCKVETRYIYQVLRGFPPEQVFAQTLLGFETVQASMDAHDDTWVGINFVMPEDGYISMRDYTLQMKMLDYLHSVYPRCTSACTPASWPRGWCRRRVCDSTSGRLWSWVTRNGLATGWT